MIKKSYFCVKLCVKNHIITVLSSGVSLPPIHPPVESISRENFNYKSEKRQKLNILIKNNFPAKTWIENRSNFQKFPIFIKTNFPPKFEL